MGDGRPVSVNRCDPIEPFDGGEVFYMGDRRKWSIVGYKCFDNYSMNPHVDYSECTDEFEWYPAPPQCLRLCPELSGIQNGRISQDTTDGIRNNYESVTEYTCKAGYLLNSRQNKYTRECQANGTWSGQEPSCDTIFCQELPRIQNGRIFQDLTDGIRNNYESVAEYTCHSGYLLNDHKDKYTRECQADGTWSGQEPYCDAILCPELLPIRNGRIFQDSTDGMRNSYRSVTEYTCNPGYLLHDHRDKYTRECQADGTWSGQEPYCDAILCPELLPIRNGRIFQDSTDGIRNSYRSVTEYTCNPGYLLNDHRDKYTRECQADGTWSGQEPYCDVPRCAPIEPFYGGDVLYFEDRKRWTQAFFSCDAGYSLFPKIDISECTDELTWKPSPPQCFRIAVVEKPDNAIVRGKKAVLRHMESYTIYCYKGYELYSDAFLNRKTARIRNNNGTLEPNVPICEEKRCLFKPSQHVCLSTDNNGLCRNGNFKVKSGSPVAITCKDGYELYRYEGRSSVAVINETSILCSKGTYFQDLKCIPESDLQKIKQYAGQIGKAVGAIIERLTCRFSIFAADRCDDSCLIPEISSGFATSSTFGEKVSKEVKHRSKITIQCEFGYELSKHKTATCKSGNWDIDEFPQCSPKPCQLFLKRGIMFWVNSKLLSEDDGATQTFLNGTKLDVECAKGFEMEDMVFKRKVKSVRRDSVCILGSWTNKYSCSPARCPIPVVQHATLLRKVSQTYNHKEKITFKCNEGHHFDKSHEPSEKFDATCLFGNWDRNIPASCQPDNCVLPEIIDDRLSVTDNNQASLSVGSTIKHGNFVYFNCSGGYVQKYEPLNRRFKCEFGRWIEDDRDPTWRLGNKGDFPACREAWCEPQCQNGGICFKDDTCRCKQLTSGERCENVLCEDKCAQNGGKCVDGNCTCPKGRFGSNCEIIGCRLPADSATPRQKTTHNFYELGDKLTDFECENNYILSSRNGMICQENSSWSEIVKCVRAVVYLISVKTVNRSGYFTSEGTDANVHIYLHGLTGHTEKINLRGRFESGDRDETRVKAKDVRPIASVLVGHDNSGFKPDWHLEFVSIYIENMNEFYIFRPRRSVWIKEYDVVIPNKEKCIHYFDKGHDWFPEWNKIKIYQQFHFGKGDRMSWRACQQECVELWPEKCQVAHYKTQGQICWGFSVSSETYFTPHYGKWNSTVYLRSCQKF